MLCDLLRIEKVEKFRLLQIVVFFWLINCIYKLHQGEIISEGVFSEQEWTFLPFCPLHKMRFAATRVQTLSRPVQYFQGKNHINQLWWRGLRTRLILQKHFICTLQESLQLFILCQWILWIKYFITEIEDTILHFVKHFLFIVYCAIK